MTAIESIRSSLDDLEVKLGVAMDEKDHIRYTYLMVEREMLMFMLDCEFEKEEMEASEDVRY